MAPGRIKAEDQERGVNVREGALVVRAVPQQHCGTHPTHAPPISLPPSPPPPYFHNMLSRSSYIDC